MPKPSYVIVITNADNLSLSLSKQLISKANNCVSAAVVSQCLAEMQGFENIAEWANDFREKCFMPDPGTQLTIRGKDIFFAETLGRMALLLRQSHEAGLVITQNNNDDYVYVERKNHADLNDFLIGFLINDLSSFCKNLKKKLLNHGASVSHVQLMNMISKYIGHQNFQSFKDYYDKSISTIELPESNGSIERMRNVFDDCKSLKDCSDSIVKKLDYFQRLRANKYEINYDNEDDDRYLITYIGKPSDLMNMPKVPMSLMGYDLIANAKLLNGRSIYRSEYLDCDFFDFLCQKSSAELFGTSEDIFTSYLWHHDKHSDESTQKYWSYYQEPKILSVHLNSIDGMESGELEINNGELRFIHKKGCEYVGSEIDEDCYYLIDLFGMDDQDIHKIKQNESVLADLNDAHMAAVKNAFANRD